jgi:hypothetical protein
MAHVPELQASLSSDISRRPLFPMPAAAEPGRDDEFIDANHARR